MSPSRIQGFNHTTSEYPATKCTHQVQADLQIRYCNFCSTRSCSRLQRYLYRLLLYYIYIYQNLAVSCKSDPAIFAGSNFCKMTSFERGKFAVNCKIWYCNFCRVVFCSGLQSQFLQSTARFNTAIFAGSVLQSSG